MRPAHFGLLVASLLACQDFGSPFMPMWRDVTKPTPEPVPNLTMEEAITRFQKSYGRFSSDLETFLNEVETKVQKNCFFPVQWIRKMMTNMGPGSDVDEESASREVSPVINSTRQLIFEMAGCLRPDGKHSIQSYIYDRLRQSLKNLEFDAHLVETSKRPSEEVACLLMSYESLNSSLTRYFDVGIAVKSSPEMRRLKNLLHRVEPSFGASDAENARRFTLVIHFTESLFRKRYLDHTSFSKLTRIINTKVELSRAVETFKRKLHESSCRDETPTGAKTKLGDVYLKFHGVVMKFLEKLTSRSMPGYSVGPKTFMTLMEGMQPHFDASDGVVVRRTASVIELVDQFLSNTGLFVRNNERLWLRESKDEIWFYMEDLQLALDKFSHDNGRMTGMAILEESLIHFYCQFTYFMFKFQYKIFHNQTKELNHWEHAILSSQPDLSLDMSNLSLQINDMVGAVRAMLSSAANLVLPQHTKWLFISGQLLRFYMKDLELSLDEAMIDHDKHTEKKELIDFHRNFCVSFRSFLVELEMKVHPKLSGKMYMVIGVMETMSPQMADTDQMFTRRLRFMVDSTRMLLQEIPDLVRVDEQYWVWNKGGFMELSVNVLDRALQVYVLRYASKYAQDFNDVNDPDDQYGFLK